MKRITQKNYGKFSDPTSLLSFSLIWPPRYPLTIPSPLPPYYTLPTSPYTHRYLFNFLSPSLLGVEPLTSHFVILHTIHLTTEYLMQMYPYFVVIITYFGFRLPNARLILYSNIHTCALHTKWNFASSEHD